MLKCRKQMLSKYAVKHCCKHFILLTIERRPLAVARVLLCDVDEGFISIEVDMAPCQAEDFAKACAER